MGGCSLVERLQLANQFLNTLQMGLNEYPPRNAGHCDAQFQESEIDCCSCDGGSRVEEGTVSPVEIVKVDPGELANAAAFRMAIEGLEEPADVAVGNVEQSVHLESQGEQYLVLHLDHLPPHVFVLC